MFSSSYKAAVIQMNSRTNLDANLEQAYNFIEEAAEQGAKIVGLPENFSFLGGLSMRMKQADEIAERVPEFLSQTASEFSIYLMGGSYPVPTSDNKLYNHSTLYNPQGKELVSYNKIHLFDVDLGNNESYRESDYVESGALNPTVYEDENIGSWGLTVCYDLRFPELYRKLMEKGSHVLSIPSAFTYTTGKDHWRLLLRARAIENTAYVFAPAQTGTHGSDRRTWGHAMIVDPWGNVIADAGTEPGVAYAEIDHKKIKEVRSQIPSLEHRRL
ncbi:putative amidohydrolase [Fodinibius salinus]|uniref:Putative amidohydrolase n=1 Tax=Fodinibius salinus TaxID=860790 RepID=A0A5D3YMM6_9BACT|nr:carbon-nitrogen hydrolase family protein [Fodinibius salinus]TYP95160.1 putative amidohydrolase [Fodinibius salinus]